MNPIVRLPRFGGSFGFYPDNPDLIRRFYESVDNPLPNQLYGKGAVVPHAGYQYSGSTLCKTLKALQSIPDRLIIIGPNHTDFGKDVSIMTEGSWEILGHTVPIYESLACTILQGTDCIHQDIKSHQTEHSIEVLLPIILSINPKVRIVPILMRNYHPSIVDEVANSIIQSYQTEQPPAFIIASSDMSHYVSRTEAKQKDEIAFQAIYRLDSRQLLTVVHQHQISMCGSGPVAVAMKVSQQQGATMATLIDYSDSAEETKDTSHVVAYAGFIFH